MLVSLLAAVALSAIQNPVEAVPPVAASAPDHAATASATRSSPLSRDTRGRPTITATINGQGPYAMVLDTAAQTSLVTLPLARDLGLPALGQQMSIAGASGQAQADLYGVDRFSTDLFDAEGVAMLALPNAGATEARGIVGMEMFAAGRLTFDPTAHTVSYQPSGAPAEGYAVVKGRLDDTGLLIVPVEIDGVAFDALVDTGAAVSVASGGALKALGWSPNDPRLKPAGAITGAGRQETSVQSGRVARVSLGPVNFRDLNLIFTPDAPADSPAEPASKPTLILGSDLLNALDAFAIDFPKAEMLIRVS